MALDFHHLPKSRLNTMWTEAAYWGPRHAPYPPPPRPRGILASTSAQGRGWVRRDEEQPHRTALRRALLQRIEPCVSTLFAAMDGKPFITVDGSHDWFGFEMQRPLLWDPNLQWANVYPLNWEPDPNYSPQPGSFDAPKVHACSPDDALPRSVVVFSEAPVGSRAVPPLCPADAQWRHLGTVLDPDGGPGVGLWSPFDADPCAPGAAKEFADEVME